MAESTATSQLVVLTAADVLLLLLLLLQLSVFVWLLRGIRRAQRDRGSLLASEIHAADRERRNIARDLHDGVIQDLAGAGYALDALISEFPESGGAPARHVLDLADSAVRRATQSLRTLIVEIAPPDLTSEGLSSAVQNLADRTRADSGVDVDVAIDLREPVDQQAATAVYRAVRECLGNIVAHSAARRARIEIRSDADDVYVVAEDDGRGFPSDLAARRRDGHVGLSLLAAAITDLGGQVDMGRSAMAGAMVTCRIPIR